MTPPALLVLLPLLVPATGTSADDGLALAPAWRRALGSGYSRVASDGELVVTQYSDGEKDWVVALAPEDGAVRWKHGLGATYLGHDGSENGPLSTPVLGEELIFALGPRGRLRALDRGSGEPRWSRHLVEELGAEEPEYGFTTTPVLAGDVLVVQVGGDEGRSLCGLDAATGELVWSAFEGRNDYFSPALLELLGRPQIVVVLGDGIHGVDPATGAELWMHPFGEGDGPDDGRVGAVDDARFLAKVGGRVAVFEVREEDGRLACAELVRTRELGGSYALPVHHDGHLYGFRSSFLTCVDAETGRRRWKSRPPGGRGLVLVGQHLVVFGAEGNVVVVRATPEAYVEESRVRALDASGYAWPAVADGRVYVRNAEEIACLTLERDAAPAVAAAPAEVAPAAGAGAFAAFLAVLASASDPGERVETFLARQESFPIVEEGQVHFVFAGEAEDVAVVGSMTGGRRAEPLHRVPGTSLFHRSYPIEAGMRWEYAFQVDFDQPDLDPRNPRSTPGRRSPLSEVVAAGHREPEHLAEPRGPRGTLAEHEFASEQLGNTRALTVYLPPGYAGSDARHPLLIVHDGPDWLEKGHMVRSLDNLIAAGRVQPLVVAFVAPLRERWFEAGGSRTEAYLAMVATELLPFLEERYRLTDDPSRRGLAGVLGFGLTSTLGVAQYPEVFGRASAQSTFLDDVARHALLARLAEAPPTDAVFYVDWNRYELRDPDLGWDFSDFSRRLVGALEGAGCEVVGGEAPDAHGWGSWSARTDALLTALFPAE
jgi:enterochelin esterase-like enzyme/outer membrane protein assembly factor BamB